MFDDRNNEYVQLHINGIYNFQLHAFNKNETIEDQCKLREGLSLGILIGLS